MLQIKQITQEGTDLNTIRQLFREYEKELDADICFQSFEAELADPLIKYGPPAGLLLLAYWNNDVAGCIALRKLNQPGHCEMKRLYVRPDFRKNKIGEKLAMELLTAAKEKGYTLMRLDTLYKLQPAIHLYEKLGFRKTEPYYLNPLPEVVYMEKSL